jgi:polyferredoxin
MALVSCLYNVVHYLVIPYGRRAQLNSIVEVLRTDVLILITFYYLRCASEEILKRRHYLIYKQVIALFFIFMTVVMISGGIVIFIKIENGGLSSKDLCL